MPVSVIIPAYQPPAGMLARTLAALEGQTCPRELFEVVLADDGSEPPLARPSTPLDVRVVRQERRGFRLAQARNIGVQAATHDILLFLDCDLLVEADWIVAHARWHHAVSDAVTIGLFASVSVDDIDAETIRQRPGSLKALFSKRRNDPPWLEGNLARSNALTSRADDLFRATNGGNLGVSRRFYEFTGGFDGSFRTYGMEDIEFSYRAYTRGGLLVPLSDTFAWHQGRWNEGRDARNRAAQEARRKTSQLIAHPVFRNHQPGRIFKVPQYVVTINAGRHPADQLIEAVVNILADRVYDLVVTIELPAGGDDERLTRLRDEFGADARVRIAPTRCALDEFPISPFHVRLPATVFARDLVYRLRARLGDAVTASTLPGAETAVSITRAWALHRARRTGKSVTDFGAARTLPARTLKPGNAGSVGYPGNWDTLLYWLRDVQGPGDAWALLKALALALRRRLYLNK